MQCILLGSISEIPFSLLYLAGNRKESIDHLSLTEVEAMLYQ